MVYWAAMAALVFFCHASAEHSSDSVLPDPVGACRKTASSQGVKGTMTKENHDNLLCG